MGELPVVRQELFRLAGRVVADPTDQVTQACEDVQAVSFGAGPQGAQHRGRAPAHPTSQSNQWLSGRLGF